MAETIWLHHYPSIIGMDQTRYMLEHNYSHASLQDQAAKGQEFYWICDDRNNEIGFIGVSESTDDSAFIHKFYILPEAQGQGAGKAAFQFLSDLYPTIRRFELQVNRQNYKSINFYFSVGFRIVRVADFDIGGGWQMNDFIMERRKP
jgi:RimJ/RimL family protein N-acetyltransferase